MDAAVDVPARDECRSPDVERDCEVCGSSRYSTLAHYTTTDWPVVRCDDCGFVYLGAAPSYEALANEHAWEKSFSAEERRRDRQRFAWIDTTTRWRTKIGHWIDSYRRRRALGLTGNVLDIGCGGSCRVPKGPTPFGIEISPAQAGWAAPHFEARGGRVIQAAAIDGFDAFDDGFFSAILMRSYLEHERQPRLVLEKAFAKLAPGGTIYVRVPDYGSVNRHVMGTKWCGWRFPDHVNYFTAASLRALAESVGFRFSHTNRLSLFDDNIIGVLKRPA
jgi:SAM-dependent methyltransferase